MAEKMHYDASGSTFKEAFKDAREEGKKSFEWNGKKYSTDWNIAGGLIVREKIGFYPSGIGIGGIARTWMATIAVPKHLRTSNRMEHYKAQGRTPLIAAMRVYLKSKGAEND